MTHPNRRDILRLGALGFVAAPLALGTRAASAQGVTHQVSIEGFTFAPATLNVAVGDTIVFTNTDGAPHTATADDGSFDTGRLNRGQSAEVTITAPGSHGYFCNFHRHMRGQIDAL